MGRMRLAVAGLVLAGSAGTLAADPHTDWMLYCQGCHLPDGRGVPPDVPSLREDLPRLLATGEGRDYLARVPGAANSALDDARLAAVLTWIATEFGGTTTTFAADEVGRLRARVLMDPAAERRRLLDATRAP